MILPLRCRGTAPTNSISLRRDRGAEAPARVARAVRGAALRRRREPGFSATNALMISPAIGSSLPITPASRDGGMLEQDALHLERTDQVPGAS